jgi:hypothetical protein
LLKAPTAQAPTITTRWSRRHMSITDKRHRNTGRRINRTANSSDRRIWITLPRRLRNIEMRDPCTFPHNHLLALAGLVFASCWIMANSSIRSPGNSSQRSFGTIGLRITRVIRSGPGGFEEGRAWNCD